MLSWILFIFTLLISLPAFSSSTSRISSNVEHVIYITLDGVRWQDVYNTKQYFPRMWHHYRDELTFYGVPGSNTEIEVASIPVSLPSYQSQMTGMVQPCDGNTCGRVKVQTFPEQLVKQLHFSKKDVVMFGSWLTMSYSFQSDEGVAYGNAGNAIVTDPETGIEDPVMKELNLRQLADRQQDAGHERDRYDYYTFNHAMHYFIKYKPKFMWISLAESDNKAHQRDLSGYHAKLRLYDDYLAQAFETVRKLGLHDKTLIIVTTDHGRGDGDNWPNHGPSFPESKRTWAFVWHGALEPIAAQGDIKRYSTLSIRPTIEKIFYK